MIEQELTFYIDDNDITVDYVEEIPILVEINGDTIIHTGNSDSVDINVVAGEQIFGHRVICVKDGLGYLARPSDTDALDKIIGLSIDAANIGETFRVRNFGRITQLSWGLLPGTTYYLSDNGQISNTAHSEVSQKIGFSTTSEEFFVSVKSPIRKV